MVSAFCPKLDSMSLTQPFHDTICTHSVARAWQSFLRTFKGPAVLKLLQVVSSDCRRDSCASEGSSAQLV